MRRLSISEIEKLANKPMVKKIAVENFLMTVCNNRQKEYALMNLERDRRLYNWNRQTVEAIKKGINKAFK